MTEERPLGGGPLRVGVTGHRTLPGDPAFQAQLDDALGLLRRIATAHGDVYSAIVVSSLAEGADRLVALRLLDSGHAALHAVLPLSPDDYQRDFADDRSCRAFHALLARSATVVMLPPAPSREDAYLAAGLYVLAHCDVLIALWDGLPPRGPSGTGAIVARARVAGLPLLWLETAPPYVVHVERIERVHEGG